MKTILIITLIVEICQVVGLFAAIMTDAMIGDDDDKIIKSKKVFIKLFIPYFWIPLLYRAIKTWWKSLD